MKKQTVFIKRYPSKREFPKKAGCYDTNEGRLLYVNEKFYRPEEYYPIWWLEEIELPSEDDIELPSEEEIENMAEELSFPNSVKFGANFILNKLKGENK